MILPIVIPAKNESDIIGTTIKELKEHFKKIDIEPFIVVVDDGSKDNTSQIVKDLKCHIVNLPDRGYSALGKPELANTFNAGFKYIDDILGKDSFEYLMIIGADTVLENNYIELLIKELKANDNLVICSGTPNNYKTNKLSVRGAGRIIKNSFWSEIGRKYPNIYYSWESYPVVYAQAYGYETKVVNEAKFYDLRDREPLSLVDWKRYGIGMKEKGSLFIYVLARALKRAIVAKDLKGSFRLLYGFVFGKPKYLYNQKLRNYTKKKELRSIFKGLKFV